MFIIRSKRVPLSDGFTSVWDGGGLSPKEHRDMTHTDLLAYLDNLEPDARKIYDAAQLVWYEKADYDTLCEEFQIAATVMQVFLDRAARSKGEDSDANPLTPSP